MSKIALIVILAAALLATAVPMVAAEVLPPGTYRRSCEDCYVDNGWLSCRCNRGDGNSQRSRIKYYRCQGDISNEGGYLTCRGEGRHRSLPQGSWRDSCRNGHMRGNTLTAECRNGRGDWVQAWLDLSRCNREVSNDNGRLVCGRSRSHRVPDGSWRGSCRNWRVEGDRLYAQCRNRDGKWHGTSVGIRGCRALANDNGRLRCVDR